MARYLSPAWFAEVEAAARARRPSPRPGVAVGGTLTLQQVVTGGPEGDVRYWLRVGDDTLVVGVGDAAADVTLVQSWETAVSVATGTASSEAAFLAGRVRLTGDLGALVTHQAALQRLDAVFAEVRARTSYE